MNNNSISIIIPCYNGEQTIIECLRAIKDSINNLSEKETVEIIVINDGSTDLTNELLKKILTCILSY